MSRTSNFFELLRGFQPHPVGGVGTPWWIKGKGFIEAACFAAGCNLRCPSCQNFEVMYNSSGRPLTPRDAAEWLTLIVRRYGIKRLAISEGEPTLNRRWLIKFFKELRKLNPSHRLHLDTNTTVLTKDFVDELVDAGLTDIGMDLKAYRLDKFMKITGITDENLARKYMENSWKVAKYII